jgi:serine/threonine protein kinase
MNLTGNALSIYSSKTKDELLHFYNLSDCFINSSKPIKTFDKEHYHQFSIIFSNKDTKYFYTHNEDNFKEWVYNLEKAINQRNIIDFYSFKGDLGEGKFGIVKLAENKLTGTKVAVKTVKKQDLNQTNYGLIKTEIDLMKVFKHKNLVQLVEIFEDYESFHIILEYLEGGNLLELLNRKDFKMTEKQAAQIIKNIAKGVQYLNSFGVIHRDLKPENVMFSDVNDLNSLKIIDFGLVKAVGPNERVLESFGTIYYVAPEIILKKAYNKQIDIWSIGVILYYVFGQIFPFDDENNIEENIVKKIVYKDVTFDTEEINKRSNDLKRLIEKCLEKDPEKRITIDKLIEDDWIKAYNK